MDNDSEHMTRDNAQTPPPAFPLNQIYFYLTKGCNLRCRHCWIAPAFQGPGRMYESLDPALFRDIIAQAKPLGLSTVKLTGGEPLIHPNIAEILDHIRSEDLSLVVETNGVACTRELAEALRSCKDPFVSVSLDAAEPEIHEWVRGVPGCFDAAVAGLRNLVAAGFRPQIIMTLMRRNIGQIEKVVRMAESLEASSVKFNLVQPTARGELMHRAGETLTVAEMVETGRWVEQDLSKSTRLHLLYSHPNAFRPLGRILGRDGDGCGVCGILSILGVLGDGTYALCGIGETVPELVFGHAGTDRLEDVWNSNPVLLEIREGLPKKLQGVCASCLMKAGCLGSCMAQNYYRSKNLWAPFWYCEMAYEQGLFPEGRMGRPGKRAARTDEHSGG